MPNGRIVINGVAYTVTLTPDGAGAQPDNGLQIEKSVELLSFINPSGVSKTTGKPYTRWTFKASDQKDYTTFKRDIATQIVPLVATGQTIKLFCRPDKLGKGFEITALG